MFIRISSVCLGALLALAACDSASTQGTVDKLLIGREPMEARWTNQSAETWEVCDGTTVDLSRKPDLMVDAPDFGPARAFEGSWSGDVTTLAGEPTCNVPASASEVITAAILKNASPDDFGSFKLSSTVRLVCEGTSTSRVDRHGYPDLRGGVLFKKESNGGKAWATVRRVSGNTLTTVYETSDGTCQVIKQSRV